MVFHDYQKQFHWEMMMALLPKIYSTEWDTQSSSILKKYGLKKLRPEVIIMSARRYGKTAAIVGMLVASLYCIPDFTIAVFSTCKRTSGKLVAWVVKLLASLPMFEDLCIRKNSEEIALQFKRNDIRILNGYPAIVKVCYFFYFFFF